MNLPYDILLCIFLYLELEDLIRASTTCTRWWRIIFGCPYIERHRREQGQEWEELDLSGTGRLYTFVPLKIFRGLAKLKMGSTTLSTRHFLQIAKASEFLTELDISNCPQLDRKAIFRGKRHLDYLEHVDISHNTQMSILSVACLCTYSSLQYIVAHGIQIDGEERLFLMKTFETLYGHLEIETAVGHYALRINSSAYK